MKKLILFLFASVLLSACGGDKTLTGVASSSSSSTSSSSSSSSSSVATAATLSMAASSPQLLSQGSVPATVSVTVKDANNVVVPGATVLFSATSGDLTVIQSTTDQSGLAKASLTTGNDPTNRAITVTASVGTISNSVAINVVGTTLTVTGPTSLVLGSPGTYSATLLDSSGNAIAGKTVAISSSLGNSLSASTLTTDSTGKATITLTANHAGSDTLSISGLGLSAQQVIVISGQNFQFTTPTANTNINVGASATPVTVIWTSNGTNVPDGTQVNFAATRGTLSAASANTVNGQATVSISSTSAGPAVVSATGTNVSAQLTINFISTKPDNVAIQASPATIATQAQSTLTATVRDVAGNLVQGQQVDFSISSGSGSLSLASAQTNAQGQAQTVYTAGSTPSGSNGITVTASFPTTGLGYTPSQPSTSTKLTVGGQAVFLSLGTGTNLSEDTNLTKFIQPWVVQAIDSAGNAVPGVVITLTVHSTRYRKGEWIAGTSAWALNTTATCANEDLNLNGVLDPGEDFNANGKLDPGDIALTAPGSVTTAADGSASFTVNYPEDHAIWVEVKLTASTTVSGTQSSTSQTYTLPILAKYVNSTTISPPGEFSPYGQSSNCGDTL